MKEILSPLPATGLSYQHAGKTFIWHHKTSGCTITGITDSRQTVVLKRHQ